MTEVGAKPLPLFFVLCKYHLEVRPSISFLNFSKEAITLYKNIKAYTNNPLVYNDYAGKMDIAFVDGQYMDVLKIVRDKVHHGFTMITHPLMGSVKPNETPYRSLMVSESSQFDIQALSIIESSIHSCESFLKDKPVPSWNEKTLVDFQVVDRHLFRSAFESLI